MKNISIFFSFTFTFIFASTTIAQNSNDSLVNSKKFVKEDPRDKVKYNLSLEQNGCEAYIIANIDIIDGKISPESLGLFFCVFFLISKAPPNIGGALFCAYCCLCRF